MDEFEESMGMDAEEASSLEDMKEDTYSDPLAGTIVGLVQNNTRKLLMQERQKKTVGYKHTVIIVVSMGLMYSLLPQKNLRYLLK